MTAVMDAAVSASSPMWHSLSPAHAHTRQPRPAPLRYAESFSPHMPHLTDGVNRGRDLLPKGM